jgi:Putative peptidoglycan binding domain
MKHLASLAVLLTFAASQVALAEETPQQQQAKKQATKHVTHTPTGVHNTQVVHKVNTTNKINTTNLNNSNVHVQTHHVSTNPNWNKQIQNTANVKSVNNAQNWKNNPNWKGNPNWKNTNFKSKNWWNGNPQWKANHAKWANYHHWDKVHRDHAYWSSHYNRFAIFGGGYYYWNNGFWYPAYGYDPAYSTYAYDAPIYAYNNQEPAQVVADVQNALGQAGYDPGPVDNTYGPQTRDALVRYQTDNGLPESGQIDEATLASLGLQ